jgi:DNA-binding transcriptional LysR family regulator
MDLNQIRSFLAVTQTLNFTNAARLNSVPQSTVSRQIVDLEEQLGAKLFYRTKRDVKLTDEGRAFLPYAYEIMESSRKGFNAVLQLHNGANGRLNIATIPSSCSFLSDCLRLFGEKYPDIAVDITYVSSGDPLSDEGEDPYDFHFNHYDMLTENEAFDSIVTHTDNLSIILPKNHPFVENGFNASSLGNEKFILVSENESPIVYMNVMNYFRANRISPHIVNECDDVRSVLLSVSASLGITILPSSQVKESFSDRLVALGVDDMDLTLAYAMVWKKSLLNPAATLFLQTVRDYIDKR